MELDPRLETPLFLGAFGLVFLVVGLYVVWDAMHTPPDPAREAQVVSVADLGTIAPGTTVILEGTIAAATPVIEADFVLLQRQVAKGVTKPGTNDIRFAWDVTSTENRPFALEGTGTVSVSTTSAEWRDPPHTTDPGTVTAGTTRLAGFKAKDQVTVLATVHSPTDVDAQVLFGGDAEAFRSSLAASAMVPRVLGGAFALVGFLTALYAVVTVLRFQRSA
jgi:hypothetical protein